MKTIALTGAFGNTGQYIIFEMLRSNINVIALDIMTELTEKILNSILKSTKKYSANFTYHWFDLTDGDTIDKTIKDIKFDAFIHLAFIIPPFSELKPELAKKINIDGTFKLIDTISEYHKNIKFLFTSSVATFGYHDVDHPEIKVDDKLSAINIYSEHKIAVEKKVRSSELDWRILKFSAVMNPRSLKQADESIEHAKKIRPDSKIEPVHVADLALAVKNALLFDDTKHQTYIIAGGKDNQVKYRDYIMRSMSSAIPNIKHDDIPWHRFKPQEYYLHWYDTEASQEKLKFQSRNIADYVKEQRKRIPIIQRILAPLFKKRVIEETFLLK